MKVQKLIDELTKLDPNQPVYLSDEDLDDDTYYYQLSGITIVEVEGENILTLTHRR